MRQAGTVRGLAALVEKADLEDPVERQALQLAVLEVVHATADLARAAAARLGP